jgi:hypothetical protein
MKTVEFNKIMKGLNFPVRFIKKGRLAYTIIVYEMGAKILVGFYLDTSLDKDSFKVQYFVQCLFVPFSTYNFSLGDRIGSYFSDRDIELLNNELTNFRKFDSLYSFDDFIPYLENSTYYGNNVERTKYFALTYFIQKDFEKALLNLVEIIKLKSHSNIDWFKEDVLNAEFIKSCIEDNNYEKGIEQILKWQSDTVKSLKISE